MVKVVHVYSRTSVIFSPRLMWEQSHDSHKEANRPHSCDHGSCKWPWTRTRATFCPYYIRQKVALFRWIDDRTGSASIQRAVEFFKSNNGGICRRLPYWIKTIRYRFYYVQPGSLLTGGPAKTAAQLKQVSENMTVEQRNLYGKYFDQFSAALNKMQNAGLAACVCLRNMLFLSIYYKTHKTIIIWLTKIVMT